MTAAPMQDQVRGFITRQRWFGDKGRDFTLGAVQALGLDLHLAELAFADGDTGRYQLPMSSFAEPQSALADVLVGHWDERWHYDATHDPAANRAWLTAIHEERSEGDVVAHRATGQEFDTDLAPTVFGGEQSNTSIAFAPESMLKVFRRVTPGTNPDIELHLALTSAGSPHVARLLGWLEAGDLQLALLQEFLAGATSGWDLALARMREQDDSTTEATDLGRAVAEVHQVLASALPVDSVPGGQVASRMRARLHEALDLAPGLADLAPPIERIYDALAGIDVPAQRIHADLHLGQTLLTGSGWKLVDFEGEPARPLDERALPDSPWRDVAGMLRSFDYAARVVAREGDVEEGVADAWAVSQRTAFLAGYESATTSFTPTDRTLVEAYELDKALYEVSYEARNRPDWIDIPLDAVARIQAGRQ